MDNIFGKRLKQIRTELNQSQEEVSQKIKITRATLSRYERGEIEPPITTVAEIARYFNVSLDWLSGNSKIKNPLITSNNLLDLYNSLSYENKIQAFSFMNYLKYITKHPVSNENFEEI